MNPESRTLVLVPGENIRSGMGPDFLKDKTRRMGPFSKINAIAGEIVAREFETNAHILTSAGDAAGLGITEAQQNKKYILDRNPELADRIFTETVSYDSSTIAENAKKFIQERALQGEEFDRIVLVDIKSHARRMAGQMKAWGIPINHTYASEDIYVYDTNVTPSTRLRRSKIVSKLHNGEFKGLTGIISWQMFAERTKEFGLNLIGLIDRKGMFTRRFTSRSRKNVQHS